MKVVLCRKEEYPGNIFADRIYGGTSLVMGSNDFICFYDWAECRLIRWIDVSDKVISKTSVISYLLEYYADEKCFILLCLF